MAVRSSGLWILLAIAMAASLLLEPAAPSASSASDEVQALIDDLDHPHWGVRVLACRSMRRHGNLWLNGPTATRSITPAADVYVTADDPNKIQLNVLTGDASKFKLVLESSDGPVVAGDGEPIPVENEDHVWIVYHNAQVSISSSGSATVQVDRTELGCVHIADAECNVPFEKFCGSTEPSTSFARAKKGKCIPVDWHCGVFIGVDHDHEGTELVHNHSGQGDFSTSVGVGWPTSYCVGFYPDDFPPAGVESLYGATKKACWTVTESPDDPPPPGHLSANDDNVCELRQTCNPDDSCVMLDETSFVCVPPS